MRVPAALRDRRHDAGRGAGDAAPGRHAPDAQPGEHRYHHAAGAVCCIAYSPCKKRFEVASRVARSVAAVLSQRSSPRSEARPTGVCNSMSHCCSVTLVTCVLINILQHCLSQPSRVHGGRRHVFRRYGAGHERSGFKLLTKTACALHVTKIAQRRGGQSRDS